jgi:hypothetical protein
MCESLQVLTEQSRTIAATPEPQTPGMGFQTPATSVPEFSPITVNISYSLRNPVDGFQFVIPSDAYPHVSSGFLGREPEPNRDSASSACVYNTVFA